nr:MAG TPA: minor tail protein [Caudoviricetes sp.]
MCLSIKRQVGSMGADSAGQIGLDLVINKNDFDRQLKGIQSTAKKAGAAIAAAFAVKKLVDFSAQCIKLGSDLQEVQNVVDVTFPSMSKQVNEFAKNAISQFGLSETMAKRFTGTFGAMAKSFGFNEQAAYEMSTALTGLAGDVASFYNISQDEAYTKLKSVFTGETESLKDLGVVMTQAALDQYALANGYGKTTAAMSEAEKVALRYSFVQQQLTAAAGDFVRTSDSWANQVRVLNLQFSSLKATIGQGLINVFTPVLKVINSVIAKLQSLADAFLAVTNLFSGRKQKTSGMGQVVQDASEAAGAVGGIGDAAKGAAGAAQTAAKDMAWAFSIDELTIVSPEPEAGGGGGAGGAGGGVSGGLEPVPVDTTALDTYDKKLQALVERVNELKNLFASGFQIGFGDVGVLDSINKNLKSIQDTFKEIASDTAVSDAFSNMLDSLAFNIGKVTGSMASIGASIVDNLTGGMAQYLSQNTEKIKDYLVSMFDLTAEAAGIVGDFSQILAEICEVFRSDSAKQITADLIGIFANAFMGVTELVGKFGTDAIGALARPFTEQAPLIQSSLQTIIDIVSEATRSIKGTLDYFFESLQETYDTSIGPMVDAFGKGFSEITRVVLEAFQIHILPILQSAAEQFSAFCTERLQPLIDKFLEFASKVAECITAVWQNVLVPFIAWFAETVAPVIGTQIQVAVDAFFLFLEAVSEIINSVLDTLNGLLDFLTGIFTGDWKKAWNGIKAFLSSTWDLMKFLVSNAIQIIWNIVVSALTAIQNLWTTIWTAIKDFVNAIWEGIKNIVSSLIDSIHQKISTVMDGIKKGISTALENIKKAWGDTWDNLKKKTEDIFNGIWSTIKGIINKIIGGVEKMANNVVRAINKMIEAVNDVADHIPGIDDELIPEIPEIHLPRLAQGGYVKANTPRLAVIGDNRREGEIVSPESKLLDMAQTAARMAAGGGNSEQIERMIALLEKIISLIEALDLVVNVDIREIHRKLKDLDKRTGYSLRTT